MQPKATARPVATPSTAAAGHHPERFRVLLRVTADLCCFFKVFSGFMMVYLGVSGSG